MSNLNAQVEELTVANEHSVQIQLINLLSRAVSVEADNDEKLSILEQLMDFSKVHFMSEQLIMRQHSYDGYDAHDNEHIALIDYMQDMKQKITAQQTGLELAELDELREKLLNHIGSQDQRLSIFLSEQ